MGGCGGRAGGVCEGAVSEGVKVIISSELIQDYLAAVESSVRHLCRAAKVGDAREARAILGKQGVLRDGTSFYFHGFGCRVRRDGREVDWDFGPEGEIDQFDAWRLLIYVRQFLPRKLRGSGTETDMRGELEALCTRGVIERLDRGKYRMKRRVS